jgi:hypothetical protein
MFSGEKKFMRHIFTVSEQPESSSLTQEIIVSSGGRTLSGAELSRQGGIKDKELWFAGMLTKVKSSRRRAHSIIAGEIESLERAS